ncbi:MAG TPA: hypothetical protein VM536_00055, partial [Chloroflexia bacterium]|nr:hypothetical protein [Chloroflexia bacterium]
MLQTRSAARPARPTPAAVLRRFQATLRNLHDPSTLYPVLVNALAEILHDPPVALFLPDPYRGGFLLQAANGPQAVEIGRRWLAAKALPAPLRAVMDPPTGPGDADPVPGTLRLRGRLRESDWWAPGLALPFTTAGRMLGFVLIGKRPNGPGYSPADLA